MSLHERLNWELKRWLKEHNLKTDGLEITVTFPSIEAYMEAYRTWKMTTPIYDHLSWNHDRPSIVSMGVRLTLDHAMNKCKDRKEQAAL